jgi:ribosome-binding factor A
MKNTGDGRRVQRMERELQETIATYLVSGFKSPLPGLVTVARVQMPADLRTAKVYISILGSDDDRQNVFASLKERSFEIQNFLGRALRSRYCPKLTFFLDDTTENVLRVERILYDLEQERILQGRSSNSGSESSVTSVSETNSSVDTTTDTTRNGDE